MQAFVNPGEAKQIEQDYTHTTLASGEMAVATAQSAAEAIQAFIQMLRERIQAARKQAKKSPAKAEQAEADVDAPKGPAQPIEIKMGREIVYREGYANKDPINKLNLNKLKLLQAAVDAPQQEATEKTAGAKGTINIKAGDELVYRMSKGAVEANRLQAERSNQPLTAQSELKPPAEVSKAAIQPPPPALPTQSPKVSERSPAETPAPTERAAPASDLPAETRASSQQDSPKVVSILDVLERQNQQVQERATQRWMQQTTRVMRRSPRQMADKVVGIAVNIRGRQVAATAVDLLQKYGAADGPGKGTYQSEKYSLSARGRMVTIADREGTALMMFRKTRWGMDILKNDMKADQEADFMRARQQIQVQGIDGLAKEPPMRSRQLGGLAPAGDAGLTRDLTALAIAKTARKLLDA
ncbi:MAG: hypothetical protein AAF289_17200, partial [Cyanobacteria bacterium P01_A01_bin.135]